MRSMERASLLIFVLGSRSELALKVNSLCREVELALTCPAAAAAQAHKMAQTASDARAANINAMRKAGRDRQLAEAEKNKGRGKQKMDP